jgi:branched-chain amino acid transport system substrate-binding protein
VIIAEDLPEDHPQKEVFMTFYRAYTDKTGDPVSTFGGHGWDSLQWIIQALKTLPEGLTIEDQRQAVRDYLENNIRDWPGTAGVFNLSSGDHYGLTPDSFTWFKVEDNSFVPFPEEDW